MKKEKGMKKGKNGKSKRRRNEKILSLTLKVGLTIG